MSLSFLRLRFVRFVLVGGTGALINLGITFVLTHFVFQRLDLYFYAYLIGTASNLCYNFTLYTISVFKTRETHMARFALFIGYSIAMTAAQAIVVNRVTPLVGLHWYLVVIAAVIIMGACINYFVFKHLLFRSQPRPAETPMAQELKPRS